MCQTILSTVVRAWLRAADDTSNLGGEGGVSIDSLDLEAYVDALLEVHCKYLETVTRNFRVRVKG